MTQPTTTPLPRARTTGLVVQELDGETLIYDEQTHNALCLNSTAGLIWKNCDGRKTTEDLRLALQRTTDETVSAEVVALGLNQLAKQNLLESSVPQMFGKPVSRRAAIRTIGITAAIALPAISMIVAPTAAQAATGGATGSPCNDGSQCASGTCNNGTCQ